MRSHIIPALAIAVLSATALPRPTFAEESPASSGAQAILMLPIEFYPEHRSDLGLSDDQMHEIQRIAEGMREPAQKIQEEMMARNRALQEAVSSSPVEMENAMERFRGVVSAENEMKSLQFRSRLAIRNMLTPEQFSKVQAFAAKAGGSRGGAGPNDIREKLQQLRQEIARRSSGGEPPREMVERLEQIEQAAKQGRVDEARQQLEAMLHHLRREGTQNQGGADVEQQMRKLAQELERTSEPQQRERIEQQLRTLRESAGKPRTPAEAQRAEGAPKSGNELQQRIQRIAEAAERVEDPKRKEQLQGALHSIREAADSGNREALERIVRSAEELLRGSAGGENRPRN